MLHHDNMMSSYLPDELPFSSFVETTESISIPEDGFGLMTSPNDRFVRNGRVYSSIPKQYTVSVSMIPQLQIEHVDNDREDEEDSVVIVNLSLLFYEGDEMFIQGSEDAIGIFGVSEKEFFRKMGSNRFVRIGPDECAIIDCFSEIRSKSEIDASMKFRVPQLQNCIFREIQPMKRTPKIEKISMQDPLRIYGTSLLRSYHTLKHYLHIVQDSMVVKTSRYVVGEIPSGLYLICNNGEYKWMKRRDPEQPSVLTFTGEAFPSLRSLSDSSKIPSISFGKSLLK